MKLDWISNHWTILAFVFACGGAWAMTNQQIDSIEDVITQQKVFQDQIDTGKEYLIRQETQIENIRKTQDEFRSKTERIEEKIDRLIEIQLRSLGNKP